MRKLDGSGLPSARPRGVSLCSQKVAEAGTSWVIDAEGRMHRAWQGLVGGGWRQGGARITLGSQELWLNWLERPRGHALATGTPGGVGLKIIIAFIMAIIMLYSCVSFSN